MPDIRRCAVYLRISLDQTGEGLAIARQRDDCLTIIRQRGWMLAAEYVDDSISASDSRKHRPAYEALVKAYSANEFDALVCYDLDRLTRQPRQLEDWIDSAEERGLALVTANGECDLTTDGGRMFARVKLAVARAEVDRKSRRQKDACAQRANLGRPPLGVRLTGYTPQGGLVPEEADTVRRIFAAFHTGGSIRGIVRQLNESGIPTRRGSAWTPSTLKTILTNPRYCGRAIYQGQPTGQLGNWEPLVSEDVFDLIQARLSDPARISNRAGTDRKHLGSGLFLCAVCDQPVSSWSQGRYRCRERHVNRSRGPVDDWVLAVVSARLGKPDAADLLAASEDGLAPLLEEARRLQDRLSKIEADYDAGVVDGRRLQAATARVRAEQATVELAIARRSAGAALGAVLAAPDPAAAFLSAPLMSQRAVIAAVCVVRVYPGMKHSRVFDPDSVDIQPK